METYVSEAAQAPRGFPQTQPEEARVGFETFVVRYRSRLQALAMGILRDREEAEDVVQETFLSAWRSLPELQGHVASWLHRICANHCLMRLRRRGIERGALRSGRNLGLAAGHDQEQESLDAELRFALERAAESLPESAREIFVLREVENLSYGQIARNLGASVPAVKSRLHRARVTIRNSLRAFYGDAAPMHS